MYIYKKFHILYNVKFNTYFIKTKSLNMNGICVPHRVSNFSTVLSSRTVHIYPYLLSHSSRVTRLITTDAVIPVPTTKATVVPLVEVKEHVEAMTH